MRSLMFAGFMPSVTLPLSMPTVMRLFDQSRREIDVFARFLIPFEELWADSVQVRVECSTPRVISRAHLKGRRARARAHDLLDAEGLNAASRADS